MADANRDGNHVTSVLFTGSDGLTYNLEGDEVTGRIYVTGSSSGTVTSVSVVSANGFAGTVATATTTPAITLSTTINSPVLAGNGTAISAATTTGSGSTVVLSTSPTLVTPILGTPQSVTLTNGTGLPISTGVSGLGTGVATALGVNTGSAGAVVLFNGALGTPSSGTLTNATGLPIVAGTTGTLSVARGGTGVTTIAGLSIWVANSADTITSVTPAAGQSVRINAGGTAWEAFTPSASVPTTITVANEATDTTCFIGFFTAATGDLGPKTNTNLTFNSNTGVLTSASLVATTADINGGTVDGAIIGGSSAAAITGTTITANTGIEVQNTDTTVTRSAAGIIAVEGVAVPTISSTDTLSNKTLTAPKIVNAGYIADANGNEQIIFTTTASAVNEITHANAATGGNPSISATGGDANVGIDINLKGTGTFNLKGNATQAAELRLYEDTDNGTNYTAFKVGSQSADVTYTLPTAAPASDGYALTSTTAGVMSWAAASGSGGFSAQDVAFATGTQTPTNTLFTSNTDGSVVYFMYAPSTTATIFRLVRDSGTSNYYITHSTTLSVDSGAIRGIAVVGSYLYVTFVVSSTNSFNRYSAADLSGVTGMSFSGTGSYRLMFSDGTNLYIYTNSANDFYKYSISGTTATNDATITYTGLGTPISITSNGTSVWATADDGSGTLNIKKYAIAGGSSSSTTSPVLVKGAYLNGSSASSQIFLGGSNVLAIEWVFNWCSATAVTGLGFHVFGITLP